VISLQQMNDVIVWDGLKDFGTFVLSYCHGGNLPDYQVMDLMKIPRLVPHIWVWDLRTFGDDGKYLINFCGEEINRSWGRNLMGETENAIQPQRHKDDYVNIKMGAFADAISRQKVLVSHVNEEFYYEDRLKTGSVETMFFPCSTNGQTINWCVGCIHYKPDFLEQENQFLLF
jgi:hypothetical protein